MTDITVKCAVCAEPMPSFMAYQMHKEVMHTPGVIQPKKGQFLTKEQKASVVERGETRIGKQHFIDFK